MPDFTTKYAGPGFSQTVTPGNPGKEILTQKLGAATTVQMTAATATTLVEFLCDASQVRVYRVTIVVTGGATYTREVVIGHDGTDAGDAANAAGSYIGDFIASTELTAWALDLNGSGASQTVRLRATLASGGTAYITEIPHRPPQRES